jgi:uncharacterized membrane protein YeaQ/YmgE (transglycosylase-associated protein family)
MMLIDYSGTNVAEISAWLLIATAAGYLGRLVVKGKPMFGLWGDTAVGLLGVFLLGTILAAFKVNLASYIPDGLSGFAMWINIALLALIGAVVIRALLRPFTGGG